MERYDTLAPDVARMLSAVWAGFLSMLAVYGAVLWWVSAGREPRTISEILPLALTALAVVEAAATIWWQRSSRAQFEAGSREPTPERLEALRANCVITWAFAESIAVYGLVLGFLQMQLDVFLPFGAATVVLLYVTRPATWPGMPQS